MEWFKYTDDILRTMAEKTGTASILKEKSGALRIYVKTDVSNDVDLPIGKTLKVIWNDQNKELTITEL